MITDICTSGKEDDYKGRFGCGGDTYTAIRCGKLRYTPSTLSPSATPSEAIVTDSPHLQNCIEDSKITLEETHESYKVEDATIKIPVGRPLHATIGVLSDPYIIESLSAECDHDPKETTNATLPSLQAAELTHEHVVNQHTALESMEWEEALKAKAELPPGSTALD